MNALFSKHQVYIGHTYPIGLINGIYRGFEGGCHLFSINGQSEYVRAIRSSPADKEPFFRAC